VFVRDHQYIYRHRPWLDYAWLDHGFGTRRSADWPPGESATLRQVHSDRVVVVDGGRGCLGEGDALVSGEPGVWLGVHTADCLPILLADPAGRGVAAVHAGWRGTAAGIVARAVEVLRARFGCEPSTLEAVIGPGIGACCYEVGPEVAERFHRSGRVKLDLAEANLRQLAQAGVTRAWQAALCTACRPDDFHSYRRDRPHAGRMVSAIRLTQGKKRL